MATKSPCSVFIWICWLIVQYCTREGVEGVSEKDLIKYLFTKYSADARPLLNASETIIVRLRLEIREFQGVAWKDEFLRWNRTDFDIPSLTVFANKVWLPDFGISNSADSFYHSTYKNDYRLVVSSDGQVTWHFGGLIRTSCNLDTTKFPFDRQMCQILAQNGAYTTNEVLLLPGHDEVLIGPFAKHGVWNIDSTSAVQIRIPAPENDTLIQIGYNFQLSRKSDYYILNLLLPCLLITIVTLGMSWLPPESGEKVSLGITVMLAYFVMQVVIDSYMPVTSDYTSRLGLFVTLDMAFASISVLAAIMNMYVHYTGNTKRIPLPVRKVFFQVVAKYLFMRSVVTTHNATSQVSPTDDHESQANSKNPKDQAAEVKSGQGDVAEIRDLLETVNNRLSRREKEHGIENEWKALAKVIDRLCFWICLVIIIFTMFGLFVNAKS